MADRQARTLSFDAQKTVHQSPRATSSGFVGLSAAVFLDGFFL